MKIWEKIEDFFFSRNNTPPTFMVFLRFSVAIFLLVYAWVIRKDFDGLFVHNPFISVEDQNYYFPGHYLSLQNLTDYFEFWGMSETSFIHCYILVFVFCCILLLLGIFGRFAAFILLILVVAAQRNIMYFNYGVDGFLKIALFYLILLPSDQYVSIRQKWFPVKKKSNYVPFFRMFQIHLAIAYFFMGLNKLLGIEWWNGVSIWKTLHFQIQPHGNSISWDFLGKFPFILSVLGIWVILIELCYPFFMFYSKTRKWGLISIILLHLFISFQLELHFFSFLMILLNIAAFGWVDVKNWDLCRKKFFRFIGR